jgi:DNA-directed RNA polymerase specialized sigma24 family protein
MAHTPSEVFTMQLARAAAKQANKFLSVRGLQKADRDDVIAAAMLWCWENRANYSLTTTLETWFMNAVRHAHQDLKRNELPSSDESITAIAGGGDETYNTVAAESSATAIISALPPPYKEVALLTMKGYTTEEIMSKGIPHNVVQNSRARIKQLRRMMLDEDSMRRIVRRMSTTSSDELSEQLSPIDIELEQLDFAPPAGKDCPPCWRCMWFEGFMPAGKRDVRMDIEDLAVREAVKSTETRKAQIAQQVRDSTIQFTGEGRCV